MINSVLVSRAFHSPRILGALLLSIVFLVSGFFTLSHLGRVDVDTSLFKWQHSKDGEAGAAAPSSPQAATPIGGNTEAFNLSSVPNAFQQTIQYFKDFELAPPFRDAQKFGVQGARTKIVRDWLTTAQQTTDAHERVLLNQAVEDGIQALYPFMRKPPRNPDSPTPFADLRSRFERGSAGIVITAGDPIVRFCAHLIVSIRSVLRSNLPIQVFYAGDNDLSPEKRAWLAGLVDFGPELEFVDILTVFDAETLQFDKSHGGWAMKPFAMLASRFEKVMLLDADAVLLQTPETFFSHPAFLRSGGLLFRDRLLWKDRFEDRHKWWEENIVHPSKALEGSKVFYERYAEEGDSGLVMLDKSRLDVLMGLMHISWQNSLAVRDSITYKITYGDKESYWFGLELTGATYEFEKHYAAMLGWEEPDGEEGKKKVCSYTIAHLDEDDRLLWYNGGLLKNKLMKGMENEYDVPNKWMVDAEWVKGNGKEVFSCMVNGPLHDLTDFEKTTIEGFIDRAKMIDKSLEGL